MRTSPSRKMFGCRTHEGFRSHARVYNGAKEILRRRSMAEMAIMRWSAVEGANGVMIKLAQSQTEDHRHAK